MKTPSRLVSGALGLFALFSAQLARAEDNPCGKFDFSNGIDCRIEVHGGCQSQCTPLHFEAACSGECSATANVSCTADCNASCNAECKPAELNCEASCGAECQSRCNAACEVGDCEASCDATCNADCGASCAGTGPSCEAHCQASCDGACTAEANINCDVDCYADLQGGCEVQCEEPSGALFCNGQYVAAGDVDACIAYLEENWNAQVDASARGEVTCDLNGCAGTGDAQIGWCSVSNAGAFNGHAGAGALAAAAVAAGTMLRRRGRKPEEARSRSAKK